MAGDGDGGRVRSRGTILLWETDALDVARWSARELRLQSGSGGGVGVGVGVGVGARSAAFADAKTLFVTDTTGALALVRVPRCARQRARRALSRCV